MTPLTRVLAVFLATLSGLAAADPAPCAASPAARQLDYWVGDWAVGPVGAPSQGHSHVHLSLDKCLLIESWGSDKTDHQGENALAYNDGDRTWHGLFVDNRGRVHVFQGAVAPGAAEFTGPSRDANGNVVLNRVKVVRVNADNVEQIWEKSPDNGATWATEFSRHYSRKKP
jgi:hypothetical protein